MKKLSLLLVVLLAAGSAGLYGQMAIGTNFSISGDATATVGYDIDDEQFGFKNDSNSDINIGLVWCTEEASMADENEDGLIGGKFGKCTANNSDKVAMSGWVGSIELKDFRIVIDSGTFGDDEDTHQFLTVGERYDDENPYVAGNAKNVREEKKERSGLYVGAPTIVAKLKNGPLFLQIFNKPESKADLVAHIEEDEPSGLKPLGDIDAESHDKDKDVGLDLDGPGVIVGYTTTDLTLSVGVASEKAYDHEPVLNDPDTKIKNEAAAEQNSSLVLSAGLKVNVGPATLDMAFVQGLENGDDLANCDFGVKPDPVNPTCETPDKDDNTGVGVKLTTVFGDISLSAGADLEMTGTDDEESTEFNEAMKWEVGGNATVTLTEHTSLTSSFIHSTVSAVATDVEVVLSDTNGLVQDLSMALTWGLFDITGGSDAPAAAVDVNDDMDMFVEADLSYAIPVGGMDDMGDDEMMMKGPTLTPGTKVTVNQLDGGDAGVGLEFRAILENAVPATTFGLKWATKQVLDNGAGEAQQGTVTAWTKISY